MTPRTTRRSPALDAGSSERLDRRASSSCLSFRPPSAASVRAFLFLESAWFRFSFPMVRNASFPAPVTVAEVAASIGSGLAKAALGGRIGSGDSARLVDTSYLIDRDTELAIVTDKDPAGLELIRHSTAHLLALCGEGAVSRSAGDDRPGDRERLLLRLRLQAPVHARGSGRDRGAGWASSRSKDEKVERRVLPRDEAVEHFKAQGELYKAEIIASIPADQDVSLYREGELRGPVPRPARAEHRQAEALQADEGGRRLLARRPPQRDAAAHLRHGLGEQGRTAAIPAHARGSREARPPQAGPRTRPVPHRRACAGPGVLAPEGLDGLAAGRAVHARGLPRQRLPRGQGAADPRPGAVGEDRPLGQVPRQHVHDRVGEARLRAEADELPRPHPDLQAGHQELPRPAACATANSASATATSPPAACTASCGCAASRRTTATSSAPRT